MSLWISQSQISWILSLNRALHQWTQYIFIVCTLPWELVASPLMWRAWKLTPPSSRQPKAFLFVTISFRLRILSIRPFVGRHNWMSTLFTLRIWTVKVGQPISCQQSADWVDFTTLALGHSCAKESWLKYLAALVQTLLWSFSIKPAWDLVKWDEDT